MGVSIVSLINGWIGGKKKKKAQKTNDLRTFFIVPSQ